MGKKITIKPLLDTRSIRRDGTAAIRLIITYNNTSTSISLGVSVSPEQWDCTRKEVTKHPQKASINAMIRRNQAKYECEAMKIVTSGCSLPKTAAGIKKILDGSDGRKEAQAYTLSDAINKYIEDCTKGRTSEIYRQSIRVLNSVIDLSAILLDDMDRSSVAKIDKLLETTRHLKENTRSIYLRCVKAGINYAIDLGWTQNYPFRRYKMPAAPTRKRSISVEAIRALISLDIPEVMSYHRDIWLITFGLIGINNHDLFNLKKIDNSRAEYIRAKTKRSYSIKVEPEIQAIIDRHAGDTNAINLSDKYSGIKSYSSNANRQLKIIGSKLYTDPDGVDRPICPDLSPYWARHSWATIAASLDIPKDVIAAALGHGGNTVTDIYIDFDQRKVDEANRKVLDWVYYGLR